MVTMIYIYRLNDGVDIDEFKEWSIREDQKTVNGFEDIESFEVNFIKGPYKKWQIFEVIKLDSWEKWREINERPLMKAFKPMFKRFVDKDSVVKFYGEKIQ